MLFTERTTSLRRLFWKFPGSLYMVMHKVSEGLKKNTNTNNTHANSLTRGNDVLQRISFFQRELSPAEYPPPIFRLVSSVQYYYSPVCTMYHLRALYLPMSYSILCAWLYSFHTYINVSKYNLIHTSLFCMFQL